MANPTITPELVEAAREYLKAKTRYDAAYEEFHKVLTGGWPYVIGSLLEPTARAILAADAKQKQEADHA